MDSILSEEQDEPNHRDESTRNNNSNRETTSRDASQKKKSEANTKENNNASNRSRRENTSKASKEAKEEKEINEKDEKRKGVKRSRVAEPEPGVSFRRKSDRKKEQERLNSTGTRVNFAKLETAALRKYKSHYKLPDSGLDTKDQLVNTVTSHFRQYHVDEKRVIARFIQTTAMRTWKNANM